MLDLYILLLLQGLRNSLGTGFTDFFIKMSSITGSIFIIIAAIYWSVNKKFGTFLLFGAVWNMLLNVFLKVTFCEYRPWIRDPTIIPVSKAGGYSFPSGHSMSAASVFGGIAISNHLKKTLRIGGCILLLLIMFSRLWLGVHTPQDVIVGGIIGCVVMITVYKILPIINNNKNADIIIAIISIIIAITVAVYATFKGYPVDYDTTGKILVEGSEMAKSAYPAVGSTIGFFVSWVIERRFVKFSNGKNIQQNALRLLFGLLSLDFVNLIIGNSISVSVGESLGIIIQSAVKMAYIVLIYPFIFNFFENKRNKNS